MPRAAHAARARPRHSGAGEKHWGELIPKFTTLREVLLHGRGWYGETCLHLLLQLMVSGGGGGSSSGAAGGGGGPGGGGGGLMVVGGGATSPRATVGSGATLWVVPRASSASACSAATGAAGGAGSATQREGSSGGCPYRSALLRLLQPVPPHLTVQPLTRLTRAELAEIASAPFEGSLYHGVTPLHLAAAKNDLPIVRALIACGATVMHAPPARGTLLGGSATSAIWEAPPSPLPPPPDTSASSPSSLARVRSSMPPSTTVSAVTAPR